MTRPKPAVVAALTAAALVGFASNSLLCRAALKSDAIDAIAFTALRLLSGAVVLGLLARAPPWRAPNLPSALALLAYALAFSLAYVRLDAGLGALLLFGAVQTSMLGWSVARGDRPPPQAWAGAAMALGGLCALVAPGLSAPPPAYAGLMALAGVAWGVYTLRGRGSARPLPDNASNFAVAAVPAALAFAFTTSHVTATGAALAIASGALASGLGYTLWYAALPSLTRTQAAVLQLCVPPLAAVSGVLFLHETASLRLLLCGAVILSGVALASWKRSP